MSNAKHHSIELTIREILKRWECWAGILYTDGTNSTEDHERSPMWTSIVHKSYWSQYANGLCVGCRLFKCWYLAGCQESWIFFFKWTFLTVKLICLKSDCPNLPLANLGHLGNASFYSFSWQISQTINTFNVH